MPDWIKHLVRGYVLNKGVSSVATQIKESDPASPVALRAYLDSAAFMDIVKAYVAATANVDDDEVVDALMKRPFNEVLPIIAASIARLKIPDLDGDPGNDISIGEFLARVVEEILNETGPA